MKCPHCGTHLSRTSASGDPMVRSSGLVLKSTGLVVICPKCKADAPLPASAMSTVHNISVLFLKNPQQKKS